MSTRSQLQAAFKLALSITLFYWFTLSMDWPMPKYGALAIAVVSTYTVGDSLLKGVMRFVGTIVGAIIGLVVLGLFAQSPVGLMFAVAAMLVVICYFGQTSRYQYAWALAAIVLIIVWSTGYGNPHSTFHFAVFRTLETIFGILIYTVVSAVLWPVTAEKRLMAEGRDLWAQIAEFGHRVRLEIGAEAQIIMAEAAVLQAAAAFEAARLRLERLMEVEGEAVAELVVDEARGMYGVSEAAVQAAEAAILQARAAAAHARAQVAAKRAERGTPGDDNPAIREAKEHLHHAELYLSYTEILAPVDGRVSEAWLTLGSFAAAGRSAAAIVVGATASVSVFPEGS